MLTPLRRKFTVTDASGQSYQFSFELADFSFAQREVGVPLTPFGDTEFWRSIESDPVYANIVLLYVGLRRSKIKALSLDWIIENFPMETMGEVNKTMEQALEDFSQRIVATGKSNGSDAQIQQTPNSGLAA